jgi:hypothetical protein
VTRFHWGSLKGYLLFMGKEFGGTVFYAKDLAVSSFYGWHVDQIYTSLYRFYS